MRLTAVCAPCAFVCGVIFEFNRIPALILGAGLAVLFLAAWTWYLPRRVGAVEIETGDRAVCIRSGVIFRKTRIVPFARTVYCERRTDILSRFTGTCALCVRLARRDVVIRGLTPSDADAICNLLEGNYDKG